MDDGSTTKTYLLDYTQSIVFLVFGIIGILVVLKYFLDFLCGFYKYFITCERNLIQVYGEGWVIITGSSDGIGKSLAKQFVLRGHKVLLVARNEQKLRATVEELKTESKNMLVEIEYVVFDFDKIYTDEDIEHLKSKLTRYQDISILINNAAVDCSKKLENIPDKEIRSMINVNITSVTFFTKIAIELMKKRRKSLIVVSGSQAIFFKVPNMAIYTATKCYLDGLYTSISQENDNIDFTYLDIGPIRTNMNQKNFPLTLSNPDSFTKSVIKHLGRYLHTSGYWLHAVNVYMTRIPIVVYIARKIAKKKIPDN